MNHPSYNSLLPPSVTKRSRGFTLLEVLIALVLVSTGLLALAGMQAGLTRNADLSRQRSEAVRLAQEQLEKIRSYSQIAAVPGAFNWNTFGWDSLVDGGDSHSVNTNTSYTRAWRVGGATTDPLRPVTVSVEWSDRTGQAQSVVLSSVVSEADPAFSASVGFSMAQSNNLKQPNNRNLNIPMPAISLGGGKSSYQIAENYAIVFDDNTGFVVKQCNDTVTTSTDLST